MQVLIKADGYMYVCFLSLTGDAELKEKAEIT
jgi:hypothetical protein